MCKIACVPVLALLAPLAAAAAELVPFAGYGDADIVFSTGVACIQSPCPSFAHGQNGPLLGLALDIPVASRLEVELIASRQATDLRLSDTFELIEGDQIVNLRLPDVGLAVSHLQVGLLRFWQVEGFEPYGVLGVGVSRVVADRVPATAADFDEVRFSASLGLGVRYRLSKRLGVRAEVRGYRVDMPERDGREPLWNRSGDLDQVLGTTGLTIRW